MAALLESGRDKSSALYKAVVKIQAQFRGYVVRKAYRTYKLGGVISELLYSPAAYGIDMSIRNLPKPKGRINAQVGPRIHTGSILDPYRIHTGSILQFHRPCDPIYLQLFSHLGLLCLCPLSSPLHVLCLISPCAGDGSRE